MPASRRPPSAFPTAVRREARDARPPPPAQRCRAARGSLARQGRGPSTRADERQTAASTSGRLASEPTPRESARSLARSHARRETRELTSELTERTDRRACYPSNLRASTVTMRAISGIFRIVRASCFYIGTAREGARRRPRPRRGPAAPAVLRPRFVKRIRCAERASPRRSRPGPKQTSTVSGLLPPRRLIAPRGRASM